MNAMRTAVLVLALCAVSCGGRTGLEVVVQPPPSMFAPGDFDGLMVQASAESKLESARWNVFATTARPYRVYVWAEQSPHYKASLLVRLTKGSSKVKEQTIGNIAITDGQINPVAVDFE